MSKLSHLTLRNSIFFNCDLKSHRSPVQTHTHSLTSLIIFSINQVPLLLNPELSAWNLSPYKDKQQDTREKPGFSSSEIQSNWTNSVKWILKIYTTSQIKPKFYLNKRCIQKYKRFHIRDHLVLIHTTKKGRFPPLSMYQGQITCPSRYKQPLA